MRLVIASNNAHKINEIKTMLGDRFSEILSVREAGLDIEIDENGSTFTENARIKAQAVVSALGVAALGDDSGLEVKALGGEPGIYSARYAGEPCSDEANNRKLLLNLAPYDDRSARFVTAMVLLLPDGTEYVAEGEVQGTMLREYEGTNGFGYDPLFYCTELSKTFGMAEMEEKNTVSHRSRALHALVEKLDKARI